MRAIVCLAQVPEDGGRLRLAPDGKGVDPEGVAWALSTFDRYALEAALRLREAHGGDVVAIHVGPDRAPSALVEAMAVGADSAVQVWDATLAEIGLDSLGVARVLAVAVDRLRPFDLILTGHHAVGRDLGQVPSALAEALGLPSVTGVVGLELVDNELKVEREADGASGEWACPMPAIVAAHKGLNEPRHRSLKGLLAAKKKPLERLSLSDLGLQPSDVAPTLRVVSVSEAPPRPGVRWLEGDADEQARAAAAWLREVTS